MNLPSLIVALLLLDALVPAQATSRPYDVSAWPQGSTKLDGFDLSTWNPTGWQGGTVDIAVRAHKTANVDQPMVYLAPTRRAYRAVTVAAPSQPGFLVSLCVRPDQAAANGQLAAWISSVEDSLQLPPAKFTPPGGQPKQIGSTGFMAEPAWVAFARDNIAVLVQRSPGATSSNIAAFASMLDVAIQQRPAGGGQTTPTPTFLIPASCKAGEVVTVASLVVPAGAVRWLVGGTAQGYVQHTGGNWQVVTTKTGRLVLTAVAITGLGWFGHMSTGMTVTP